MAIKPILFNTDMVRAILDGRKTCTRRKVDKDISNKFDIDSNGTVVAYIDQATGDSYKPESICKYQAGDVMYVRETWGEGYEEGTYIYKADDRLADLPTFKKSSKRIYHPSIHMPKQAARIWLKVTDVKVERLQEITEDEAKAEGANWKNGKNVGVEEKMRRTAVERFSEIWDSTIKKSDLDRYGWDANPYVFVIEFERCEKPEVV